MKIKHSLGISVIFAVLGLFPHGSVKVSADTVPPSTMPAATSTSSTVLPTVMPPAHSNGSNSFLTINDTPRQSIIWPACQYDSQTYCYESLKVIDANGAESLVTGTIFPSANCHNNGGPGFDPVASPVPCDLTGADWMDLGLRGDLIAIDLLKIYHWKLRVGKIEPDILMLGDTQKTVIGGSSSTGWTIEIWAKPTIKAYLNGCYSAASCSDTSVASSSQISISGYLRMLGINQPWPSVVSVELRDALRGTFISTNGMSQSWTFSKDTFFVTAVSPHFLPPDSSGKSEVTPGYVRVFLPAAYLMFDRGYKALSLVTADRVKLTVSGENAQAKVTNMENGILVDTGVTHFSSPNPEMMVLKAGETSIAPTTPITQTLPASTAQVQTTPSLKKGATKSLSSLARTTSTQKPKWTAKGSCKIVGTKLVALKKTGMCTVTVRVLNSKKKYVVKTTKLFAVE